MAPISVRRSMVAIVKKNYVSGPDFSEAPSYIRCWLRLPVTSIHRPHHDFGESSTLRCLKKLWTAEAIWRSNALRTFPSCLDNSVIAAVQFVHNLLGAEEHQTMMSKRVVAD